MSIQSNVNKVIGGIAGASLGINELKKKNEIADNKVLKGNYEEKLANKTINNEKELFNKKNKLKNDYQIARIKKQQAVANEFRESMASMINSKISNPDMPMNEKLELQNKLFDMEDDEIIANLDLFSKSNNKINSLKEFKLKEIANGNSK